ncbi:hypothetical protein ACE6H2_016635 [Prunus campanulata]
MRFGSSPCNSQPGFLAKVRPDSWMFSSLHSRAGFPANLKKWQGRSVRSSPCKASCPLRKNPSQISYQAAKIFPGRAASSQAGWDLLSGISSWSSSIARVLIRLKFWRVWGFELAGE